MERLIQTSKICFQEVKALEESTCWIKALLFFSEKSGLRQLKNNPTN